MGWLGGQPVASISVVRYGAGFGFLGFYIVVPRHRGQGHGIALWRAGMARLEGPVFLDPPEPNAAALRLAERHGLAASFGTARMYRGPAPELPLKRIFGITSFELG
jgi:RimJ/RimL family protein N-acetyltransferase